MSFMSPYPLNLTPIKHLTSKRLQLINVIATDQKFYQKEKIKFSGINKIYRSQVSKGRLMKCSLYGNTSNFVKISLFLKSSFFSFFFWILYIPKWLDVKGFKKKLSFEYILKTILILASTNYMRLSYFWLHPKNKKLLKIKPLAISTFSTAWNSMIKTLIIGRMDNFKAFSSNGNSCANA